MDGLVAQIRWDNLSGYVKGIRFVGGAIPTGMQGGRSYSRSHKCIDTFYKDAKLLVMLAQGRVLDQE